MIDTDKYTGHDWDNQPLAHEVPYWMKHKYDNALMIIARYEAEVKRLQKRNEWLEEVVAQAHEHYHIDLSDEGWPRWREEE